MADSVFSCAPVRVETSAVKYTDSAIEAEYVYASSRVIIDDAKAGASSGHVRVVPTSTKMTIRTEVKVPKVRPAPLTTVLSLQARCLAEKTPAEETVARQMLRWCCHGDRCVLLFH
jgi:hypothetical protein